MTPILRSDIEYAIHCEPDGTIIGPISKLHAHLPGARQALTHYSTWSMVFHSLSGRYGIQQKNPKKLDKSGAGKWDMGVAGHNAYVKDKNKWRPQLFDETLAREAYEEIGLPLKMYPTKDSFLKAAKNLKQDIGYIFDKFHYKTEANNEWVGLGFILVLTQDVKFKDKEVVQFRWLTPYELRQFLDNNTDYCAPLSMVFKKAEKFRKKYLKI